MMAQDRPPRNQYDITQTSDSQQTWRTLLSEMSPIVASLRAGNRAADPAQDGTPLHMHYDAIVGRRIQMALPPETYVIRYYVAEPGGAMPPLAASAYQGRQNSLGQPYIRTAADIEGLEPAMHGAVVEAFDTIEAQLPGRFRFERVTDPARATLTFVSIRSAENEDREEEGSAHVGSGVIGFNRVTRALDPLDRRALALHEILHGLGLDHPHAVREGKTANMAASYRETVMTYAENNGRSSQPLHGTPAGLMPADIAALLVLYPIAEDRRLGGARVDQIPAEYALTSGAQLRQPYGDRPVRVPVYDGVAYMAAADTDADTYTPAIASGIGHRIIQKEGHVEVEVHRIGATHIPVHLETIEFGPEDRVRTAGNVTVRPHDPALPLGASISVSGAGNVVQLDAAALSRPGDFTLSMMPGSQTRLEISNGAAFSGGEDLLALLHLQVNGVLRRDMTQAQWSRTDTNRFTIQAQYAHTGESMALEIAFDHLEPMAAARFQAALEGGRLRVEGFHGREDIALQRHEPAMAATVAQGHGLHAARRAPESQER